MEDSKKGSDAPDSLDGLLDNFSDAAEKNEVSLDDLMDMVGRRSFGSLLLLAGLLTLAPVIGDVPGVPTVIGVFVFLIAGQLLFGMEHFWLPRWLLNRTVKGSHLEKAVQWMRSPARFVDKMLKARYSAFVNGTAKHVIAAACIAVAMSMPVMEFVPFSANAAGVVLTAFGLALIARDGLVALVAFVITGLSYFLIALSM
ncbi:MAG: exopolysaccharide biosynthesis protein [Pseudohongiella nitratireducens]|nr:exopolysaccharide biosynthesis protein [Pseudohongiella nitratireducens]MDF1622464.1 exopolysaccharide biosynthesis protein [Pseudohongiella nitratireducens]